MSKKQGAGLLALKAFKAETGLSTKDLAGLIKVPAATVARWLSPAGRNPPHDGFLELAVAEARRRYAAGNRKARITKTPTCPWCGEPLPIIQDGRKIKSDHTCPVTGYRHVLTKRQPDLAYRALTPIVRAE